LPAQLVIAALRRIFEIDVAIDYTDRGVPLLPQTMRPIAAT
jgi:hypothetical protein